MSRTFTMQEISASFPNLMNVDFESRYGPGRKTVMPLTTYPQFSPIGSDRKSTLSTSDQTQECHL